MSRKYKVSGLFNKKAKCYVVEKTFERLHDMAIAAWTQIDDMEKLYPHIDRILVWSVNEGIEKRLKRPLDLGKWKARGDAARW